MKILFQGDSITHGGRIESDWDFNHHLGHGYVFNIAGELGALYPEKDYIFINKGISGDRVVDLYARWREDTIQQEPDVLSILVGVNDMIRDENYRSTPNKVFKRTYEFLVEDVKSALPNVRIILCEPFCLDISNGKLAADTKKDLKEKQQIVYDLSEKYNTELIYLQRMFEEACKKKSAEYWLWDGRHPSAAGHYLIAKQWISTVLKQDMNK